MNECVKNTGKYEENNRGTGKGESKYDQIGKTEIIRGVK